MSIAVYTKPVEKKVKSTNVKLLREDLMALPVDAVVYYAREDLEIGTGYGTAIQMRAGLAVKKELQAVGSIGMGGAVMTTAGDMKCGNIIHACGPKHLEPDLEQKLRACMENTLKLAKDKGLKTLAPPPMGTGFYGVPPDLCSKVMLETIKKHAEAGTSIQEITICTIDKRDFNAFKDKVANL